MRHKILRITAIFALTLIFSWGIFQPAALALTDEQSLLAEVWRIVNRAYLDETFNHQNWWFVREGFLKRDLTSREETYDAIREMLGSLDDPYTRLLPPEQYRSLQTSTAGELTGVGLQISKDNQSQSLQIIAPIEGSPAATAHLQPRDRIIAIDGLPTEDLTLDEAANHMRGPIGTKVVLTIVRGEEAPQDIPLVRDVVNLNPVFTRLARISEDLTVGYIRLSQFNANAASEVSDAIKTFEQQNVNGYILDLRNNPGGLLSGGIDIARQWLDDGKIVYTFDRRGVVDDFEATGSALTDAPLVILVNEGTASASEILAGALQDNRRAQLVGSKTFGKGLIQSLFDLSDGSGLIVTVAKYKTPANHDINRLGIRPNQTVPLANLARDQVGTEQDTQYQAAIDLLSQSMVMASAP
ncbi:S41 family peptidase [Oscillatoria sp. CS-180]|uniref:carboxyl-terminal processing protease CtpA n=1 Tax=Oscillatoria sp. CS-180 TaxID=3021720 RepID=UPI00232E7164|nr:carboxyl-terminal processing protease CtpA [Oscillatoria sp. CS-180]MDB9529820.1 S41 family peptidase [Oscillatoria sp. CS-180]